MAAIIRLLQFRQAMQVVLLRRKDEILDMIKDNKSKDRADTVLSAAQPDHFWTELIHMVQTLLPLRIAVRVLESDTARLDQVLEQYGHLLNHFSGTDHMLISLEKRWAKMEQKLFLLAYVLHPARHFSFINSTLSFAYSSSIAMYATGYYDRFFGSTADEKRQRYKQVASYLDREGAFGSSIPNYQDPKEHPGVVWSLMRQVAPQLSKLAKYLSQVAVNSVAVERLFFAFGNIQTKRRSSFVHARVQKLATIKSMLPVKPRPKKKIAGSQYLGGRTLRCVTLNNETAIAEATQAKTETERQFMDDSIVTCS